MTCLVTTLSLFHITFGGCHRYSCLWLKTVRLVDIYSSTWGGVTLSLGLKSKWWSRGNRLANLSLQESLFVPRTSIHGNDCRRRRGRGAAVRPRLNLLLSAEPAKGEARARRGRWSGRGGQMIGEGRPSEINILQGATRRRGQPEESRPTNWIQWRKVCKRQDAMMGGVDLIKSLIGNARRGGDSGR